jgi:hypothetical protein
MLHTTKKRFANIGKPYAHHKGTFGDIYKGAKIAFANIGKPDAPLTHYRNKKTVFAFCFCL